MDEERERPPVGKRTNGRCAMSPSARVSLAAVMAAFGGLLFGYDTGIISGALLQLRTEFGLDCTQSEVVVSILLLGALLASLCGGFLVDYCGRKQTIIVNDVVFLTGTILLSTAHNYTTLVIGRFIVGFAVSLSATAECIYIAEISPAKRRGMLVSLNEFGITVGFLLAYLFNFTFISLSSGWRYMFGMGAVLAVIQAIGMLFLPPSPRYLLLRNKNQEARQVLHTILTDDEDADVEFERIKMSIDAELRRSWRDDCCADRVVYRMFLIAIPLLLLQQLSGQASVLYYAPLLFQQVGFHTDTAAVMATVGLGVAKVVLTSIYLLVTDKAGRRTLLLTGTGLMLVGTLSLGVCAFLFFDHPNMKLKCGGTETMPSSNASSNSSAATDRDDSNDVTMTNMTSSNDAAVVSSGLALASVIVYVAGYSIGFGPGTWLLLSELFPSHIKGRAIAVSTCFNWATNLVVSVTFLDFISAVGTSMAFCLYGVVCCISLVFISFCVPETKDRNLEDISAILQQKRHYCDVTCRSVDGPPGGLHSFLSCSRCRKDDGSTTSVGESDAVHLYEHMR